MHLVSDPEQYRAAMERHRIPFFHTACGSVEPTAQLTEDVSAVRCPHCRMLIQQAMGEPEQEVAEPEPSMSLDLGDDDMLDMVDDIDSSFDAIGEASVSPPVDEPDVLQQPPSPFEALAALQPMLAPLFGIIEPSPEWIRWTLLPDEDPAGSAGFEDVTSGGDIRERMRPEHRKFLAQLTMLSNTIGLQDLASRVLTVIHELTLDTYTYYADQEEELNGTQPSSTTQIAARPTGEV